MAKQDTDSMRNYPFEKTGKSESVPSVESDTYAKNKRANTTPLEVGLPRTANKVKGK
jgi:hypothetical protein